MTHIFGPVPSRRLGYSLGVDVIPPKTCTCDCIYCQVGKTTQMTSQRGPYVGEKEIIDELTEALARPIKVDTVTFSGSGEPTLNSRLGSIIRRTKRLTDHRVAVITNSTLIDRLDVREDLYAADIVLPSLHAADQRTFERICRPADGISIDSVIDGLITFRGRFKGQLWVEVMLLRGINDSPGQLARLKRALDEILPDKIQVGTVTRPPQDESAIAVDPAYLKNVCGLFSTRCEVISQFSGREHESREGMEKERILSLLARRSATLLDIVDALQIHRDVAEKLLQEMAEKGQVKKRSFGGQSFYVSG